MNIENILKPDVTLVAAVSNVNERELKLSALFERGNNGTNSSRNVSFGA